MWPVLSLDGPSVGGVAPATQPISIRHTFVHENRDPVAALSHLNLTRIHKTPGSRQQARKQQQPANRCKINFPFCIHMYENRKKLLFLPLKKHGIFMRCSYPHSICVHTYVRYVQFVRLKRILSRSRRQANFMGL